jgi:hypothetical protein
MRYACQVHLGRLVTGCCVCVCSAFSCATRYAARMAGKSTASFCWGAALWEGLWQQAMHARSSLGPVLTLRRLKRFSIGSSMALWRTMQAICSRVGKPLGGLALRTG